MIRFPTTWDASVPQPAFGNRGVVNDSPVGSNVPVSFGYREQDVNHPAPGHSGLDLAVGDGTPIIATIDSWLYAAYELSGQFGNFVVLRSEEMFHLYAHMQDPFRWPLGSFVPKGTEIGKVGMTGFTTGPHLHWMCSTEPSIIYSALPGLHNPMARFALPEVKWADLILGPEPPIFLDDPAPSIAGARRASLIIPNPPILGPID